MSHTAIALRMKRDLKTLLDQQASVYTRTAGGDFTTLVKSGLACSFQAVNAFPPPAGPDRAVMTDLRTLYFDPDYDTFPEDARVEVSTEPGIRWNVVKGTITPDIAPGNVVVMRHCEVRRSR